MVRPELHRGGLQPIDVVAKVWHNHCKECAKHVDENGEVIQSFHFEDQHQGNDEHCRIAKVQGPVVQLGEDIKAVKVAEGDHGCHADVKQGKSSLFVFTSCNQEVYNERKHNRAVKNNSVCGGKIV